MIIAPSLLAADHASFGKAASRAARAKADWLHLDIMDGHFVPNISFGPQVVKAIRPFAPNLFFDVHLMCSRAEILLEPFAKAGADQIIIHVELGQKVESLIWKIKQLGKKVGLAVNPPTPVSLLQPFLDKIDLVLVMTVNPGFGGQEFIHETLPKIQQVADWRAENKFNYRISVDGGINLQTAVECARAGSDTFVAGTSLFGQRNLKSAIAKLKMHVSQSSPASISPPETISK